MRRLVRGVELQVRRAASSSSFLQTIAQPFDPFSLSLWVLIFSVFGFVGVMMRWENRDASMSTYDFFTSAVRAVSNKSSDASRPSTCTP